MTDKNPVGRPLKYTSKEEVEIILDNYFTGDAFVGEGDARVYVPTMSGLAMALDLSRQGLLEYSNKDEFSDAIKKARQKVEVALEQRLAGSAPAGTIFNLKNNFGWKDKTEQEMSGSLQVSDMTSSQIDERIRALNDELKGKA